MNLNFSPHEQREAIKYAAIGIGMVLTYVFLWRKQRALATIILIGFTCYILAYVVDWAYWRTYFMVDGGTSGLGN